MESSSQTSFDIAHTTDLARLRLSRREKTQFSPQFKEILEYVEKIAKLKMEKVPPTFQTTDLKDVVREDRVDSAQSLNQEEALANAPARKNGFFRVKPVR